MVSAERAKSFMLGAGEEASRIISEPSLEELHGAATAVGRLRPSGVRNIAVCLLLGGLRRSVRAVTHITLQKVFMPRSELSLNRSG